MEKAEDLRNSIFNWFEVNGRDWIPWKLRLDGTQPGKDETLSVYGIWIAEVMLQQTQLKVVLPYWQRWMKAFPNLIYLANADEQKVLLLWQGLGYYSRARRIHKASKTLLSLIGANDCLNPNFWPKELDTWIALPGIGRSTAGSIVSSAFNLPSPILDGNVKRLLARLIASPKPVEQNLDYLWKLSTNLLDLENPRHFNQALMDLGALVCTPRKPMCKECPLQDKCAAYSSSHETTYFPVKSPSKKLPFQVIGVGIVFNKEGKVLIDQRLDEGLLGGLWEFPGGKQEKGESIEKTILRELTEELAISVEVGKELIVLDHSYSHKKLRFVVHICQWISGDPKPLASQQFRWVNPTSLGEFPFPAANSIIIKALNDYLLNPG